MKDFNFKVPQVIEFGLGSLKKLPAILDENKLDHVYLVSDRGLEAIGVVKKIQDIIEAGGIKCTTYLDVLPNPTVDIVNEAVAGYKASGASSIIAVGGGSPMDVAKAVSVLAQFGGTVHDYVGLGKVPVGTIPMIAIPTTAGTGSEVTASCVITDEEANYKMSIISYEILPKYAVLDPELIMTAPASIAAACGVDAFIHAMEAYVSTDATLFSDAMGEKAMELIGGNLRRFVANRKDEEAACAMMAGSTFAGIAFAWAKLGNIHGMSHPVSAYFHIAHGVANAILMPTVVEYNALADNGRYEKIYNYLSTDKEPVKDFKPSMLVDLVKELNAELGIPASLSAVGVTEDKFEEMATDAMKTVNVMVNPRQTGFKDVVNLYQKAF
ncbi:iron-containing alcohol dehydrogenase [Chakrabartyella piscis]|uniref:iron-containing alcohol dehydrogenase n=1 Tax=Chakrabartyella piscis TaxID=2918914 RepID=UPI002958BA3B|nr:iron-containing alcohol dehydrogenase [Chakrabartyella piscis]